MNWKIQYYFSASGLLIAFLAHFKRKVGQKYNPRLLLFGNDIISNSVSAGRKAKKERVRIYGILVTWVSGVSGEKGKDGSEKGRELKERNFLSLLPLSHSPLRRPDTQASILVAVRKMAGYLEIRPMTSTKFENMTNDWRCFGVGSKYLNG